MKLLSCYKSRRSEVVSSWKVLEELQEKQSSQQQLRKENTWSAPVIEMATIKTCSSHSKCWGFFCLKNKIIHLGWCQSHILELRYEQQWAFKLFRLAQSLNVNNEFGYFWAWHSTWYIFKGSSSPVYSMHYLAITRVYLILVNFNNLTIALHNYIFLS